MKRAISGLTVSLAAMSVAGLAFAAAPQSDRVSPAPTGNAIVAQASPTPPTPPAARPDSGSGGTTAPSAAQPKTPPPAVVGKDLVNTKGQKIGKIDKIDGDQVVVSVGGFLGIGAHKAAVPWSSLTTMGNGSNLKVETAMTEDELKQLPAYKSADESSIRAMPPAGKGAGGGGGTTSSPSR
jgi:hypothetical protein